MSAALGVVAADNGAWWWTLLVLATPLALFGVILLVSSAERAERDAGGRLVIRRPNAPQQH